MIELLLQEPVQNLIEQWPALVILGVAVIRLEMRMGACFASLTEIIHELLEQA